MEKRNQNFRLFGRTRGRSNKNIDISEYNKRIKKYKLNKLFSQEKYILDIGTGYGETSIYLSKKYLKHKIIACEKYIDGNLNLIRNIEKNKIKNIYLYPGNFYELLSYNQIKQYFDIIFIFFPDPWPKKKHNKRRLVNNNFLKKIRDFIHINGLIYIATDSFSYSKEIIKSIYNSKKLYKWINQNDAHLSVKDYFDLETKFYKKAIICGRKPSLFILKKI